jgi:hypothetical protein
MNVWAFLMLVSGGLFAGGVTALAWDRIPAWRSMPQAEFRTDFAGVVQRADRVQPGLLVLAIVASFAYGLADAGAARILALTGGFRLPGDPHRIRRRPRAAPAPDDLLLIVGSWRPRAYAPPVVQGPPREDSGWGGVVTAGGLGGRGVMSPQ